MNKLDPIVVSGCGIASPWGIGSPDQVLFGPARLEPTQQDDGAWRLPDDVLAPDTKRVAQLGGDRACLLSIRAIDHAFADAGFELDPDHAHRVGLVVGSAGAALPDMMHFAAQVKEQTPRFVSPIHFPQTVGNYAAGALARHFKINGPNLTFGQTAHGGLIAVAEACRLLNAGWADVVLAGGADAVNANLLSAQIDSGQVAPSGPFAAQPAEAACFVLLERESHARARDAENLVRIDTQREFAHVPVLSADLTGNAVADLAESNDIRSEIDRSQDWKAVLSARHSLANCFAAASAAQLALAVLVLRRQPVAVWNSKHSGATSPPESGEKNVLQTDAILVASAPDTSDRRTTLCVCNA